MTGQASETWFFEKFVEYDHSHQETLSEGVNYYNPAGKCVFAEVHSIQARADWDEVYEQEEFDRYQKLKQLGLIMLRQQPDAEIPAGV
jgi:hypothetical protein